MVMILQGNRHEVVTSWALDSDKPGFEFGLFPLPAVWFSASYVIILCYLMLCCVVLCVRWLRYVVLCYVILLCNPLVPQFPPLLSGIRVLPLMGVF